jgi:NADPH-dependent glutamate synthase beta subunit-like oxidoreductase
VTSNFTEIGSDPRVQYFGNVDVGVDISVTELRRHYDAVVLCHGCEKVKRLGIPGSDLLV